MRVYPTSALTAFSHWPKASEQDCSTPIGFKWNGYQACTMIQKVRFKELPVIGDESGGNDPKRKPRWGQRDLEYWGLCGED
jgi:hypothetical protein